MSKRIVNIVPDSQQRISTRVKQEEKELEVQIRACSPLDKELRQEFHKEVRALGTEAVPVRSTTDFSNQGNETGQDVTAIFNPENTLNAIDIISRIVQVGIEYYDKQLERELAREEDKDTNLKHSHQLKYFDEADIKEFCLLYRGRVNF